MFPQLAKLLGERCELDFSVQGWSSNHSFTVKGVQGASLSETQVTGCTHKPQLFTFDIATGVLAPIASPKTRRLRSQSFAIPNLQR